MATSLDDLKAHIVGSAPAAARVCDAMRLLPMVLLRHDARVQRAYDAWLARAVRFEDAGQFTEAAAMQSLFEDSVQLNALVRELKLQGYQSWLPQILRWEFQRALEGVPTVEVTMPWGLEWATRGKAPKGQRSRGPKGFRLEDLPRQIDCFYRCVVKDPPDKKTHLAISQGKSRVDVQHEVKRARLFLECIDAPMPQSAHS